MIVNYLEIQSVLFQDASIAYSCPIIENIGLNSFLDEWSCHQAMWSLNLVWSILSECLSDSSCHIWLTKHHTLTD